MFGVVDSCSAIRSGNRCETSTTGANVCIARGPISFYCPTSNYAIDTKPFLVSASIICQPCAVAAEVVDTNAAAGEFSGRITWGPNMRDGSIDEKSISGYKVVVVDRCGLPLEVPGGTSFRYLPKHGLTAPCCAREAYSLTWSLTLPERYSHFMVVPYSDDWGEQDAGPLIRIVDLGGRDAADDDGDGGRKGISNGAAGPGTLAAVLARAWGAVAGVLLFSAPALRPPIGRDAS